jgi:hypothetical protein
VLEKPSADAETAEAETRASEPSQETVLGKQLLDVRDRLADEIKAHGKPLCYLRGDFYDRPVHPVFALHRSKIGVGLDPKELYQREIFVWLPHLLPGCPEKFKCTCGDRLSRNGLFNLSSRIDTKNNTYRLQRGPNRTPSPFYAN